MAVFILLMLAVSFGMCALEAYYERTFPSDMFPFFVVYVGALLGWIAFVR